MVRLRLLCCALAVSLLIGSGQVRADEDQSAGEKLARAVRLYNDADYSGARQLLRAIDTDDLSEDQLRQRQRYLDLSAEAIARVEEAKRDFDRGTSALNANRPAEAERHFSSVTNNPFAPSDLRFKAQARLRDIAQSSMKPLQGSGSMTSGTQNALNQASLVDQLSREHVLLWQKAVATYKDAAKKIRKAVLTEDFEEAYRLLDFGKQTIEQNRRYASPATEYEDYRQQVMDLEAFIDDEKQAYDEQQIQDKIAEVEDREKKRIQSINENKQRRIDQLMNRATELRKERRLEESIEVLGQVIAVDANHEQAKWMLETLEDLAINMRDRRAVRDRHREAQDLFVEMDEDGVPWHDDMTYPKNWLEIRSKRLATEEAGESPEDREVRKLLKQVGPELRFDNTEFSEVIDKLRALTGLNIVPNWSALEASAIEKDAEVTLHLTTGVSWEKALNLILDEVGAGEVDLAFEVDGGVISISTKDDLSRRTIVRVYNVQDLLISVPTFRGRQINLQNIGQNQGQLGGLGGGRFLQGGGGAGGAGGGQGGGGLFQGDGGGDEEEFGQDEDPLEPIIDLIQETIDPESWREAGGNVGAISSHQQQLIVTQTATAHSELRDLLSQLRQARALQIAVEARYITIARNWLEQIGVDLDIVLNNGNAGFDRTTLVDPITGNPLLVPRQFTRLGFGPGAPGGVGITMPTTSFDHPFGQPGLVPPTGNVGPASGSMTPIPIVNNTLDLAAPSDTNVDGSLGSLVNTTPAFQIFGSFLDNIQVDFLLRASQVDRRSSDLDAPKLVLFNGQRATFEAFIEQDYIAALTPVIGDNAGAFLPNVDTALTGRSLDVQATVSADRRYVTMTVRTFTRVTGDFRTVFFGGSQTVGSGFIELATQTTQQIRTTVSVPDGGTLLIGGLKLSGERDVDAGVPILSRIPILKRAFSNTSNVKDDQVLLILIKPTIIIQEEREAEAFPTLSSATSGF